VDGYARAAEDAVLRTRFDVAQILTLVGGESKTRPTTFFARVAPLLAPPYEWPPARTGPGVCSKTLAVKAESIEIPCSGFVGALTSTPLA
jgi:hypothetical protein